MGAYLQPLARTVKDLAPRGRVGRTRQARSVRAREWHPFDVGFYPHSIAVGRNGPVWANGYFT